MRTQIARGWVLSLALAFGVASVVTGQETVWTGSVDSLFTNDGNWTDGSPADFETIGVIETGPNQPVVIDTNAGRLQMAALQVGLDEGGSLSQSGGTVILNGAELGAESGVGINATEPTRWVLRENASVEYDSPRASAGSGFDTDGGGLDFDVGQNVADDAVATLELHDQATFRISDDLKVADGSAGHGRVVMTGDSMFAIGSGISASGTSTFELSGNAMLISGNSSNAGDSVNGRTNEGYFTLSTDAAGTALVQASENAKIYVRTLQQRNGLSEIELTDQAEFHVFDVFNFPAPDPGVATVVGAAQDAPQRTTHVSQTATAETLITLSDSSVFSVDSDLEDSGWAGFAVSGGNNTGGNSEGGLTTIEVRDSATFRIVQDLHMTLGTGDTAESFLSVRGPDATVEIGGDLRLALDEFDTENLGEATLLAVLTGNSHTTIHVGGTAWIANGNLEVTLDGYTPRGGESYTLLNAASIDSSDFLNTSLPTLPDGLDWDLTIDATSVTLSVLGGTAGDYDGNGVLDANDIELLSQAVRDGNTDSIYDLNGDSVVNGDDRLTWINDLANTYVGDSDLNGVFDSGDLVFVFSKGEYEDNVASNSTWADGDWDGNGDFDSADFVIAFSAGGYDQPPKAATAASVPEPTTGLLTLLASLALCMLRRSR